MMAAANKDLLSQDGHPLSELYIIGAKGQDQLPPELVLDYASRASRSCVHNEHYSHVVVPAISWILQERTHELRSATKPKFVSEAISSLSRCISQANSSTTNGIIYSTLDAALELKDSGIGAPARLLAAAGMVRTGFLLDGKKPGPETGHAVETLAQETLLFKREDPDSAKKLFQQGTLPLVPFDRDYRNEPDARFALEIVERMGTIGDRPALTLLQAVKARLGDFVTGSTNARRLVAISTASALRREGLGARASNARTDISTPE